MNYRNRIFSLNISQYMKRPFERSNTVFIPDVLLRDVTVSGDLWCNAQESCLSEGLNHFLPSTLEINLPNQQDAVPRVQLDRCRWGPLCLVGNG